MSILFLKYIVRHFPKIPVRDLLVEKKNKPLKKKIFLIRNWRTRLNFDKMRRCKI